MKLTIRMKLMSSFLVIIVFLIIISASAIFRMDGMGDKTKEINDNWLPSVKLLGQLNGDVSDVQRLLLKFILEPNTSEMNSIESRIEETKESIKQIKEQYEPMITSDEEKEIYQSFSKNYKAYIETLPAIMESGRSGNFEEANMLQLESHPLWQGANNSIIQLMDLNKKGAEEASKQSVKLNESGRSIAVTLSLIGIAAALIISYVISQLISKPIIALTRSAEQIASGDLTGEDLNLKYRDELGQLDKSFTLMKQNLRDLIQQANYSAEHVAAASEELTASSEQTTKATEQIATSMQEVSIGVENQVRGVTESSAAMSEISVGIQQIASRTQQVSSSANVTAEKATIGNESIQTAVEQMNSINETVTGLSVSVKELGESSQEIGKIVDVITNIAGQTNLLSLNAAIEAARAGEHGRGFAVVADEVRKLAEQSARSSEQISQLIAVIKEETNRTVHSMDSVITEVAQGIGMVNEAGQSFEQIRSSIDEVTMQIQEVSAAIQQMSAGSEQVVESIHMISSIAEESSAETQNVSAAAEQQLATMEEISASATSLAQMAVELQSLIGKFKV